MYCVFLVIVSYLYFLTKQSLTVALLYHYRLSLYISPVHYRQSFQTCGPSRSGRRDHGAYQNVYLFITREVVGQYGHLHVCRYSCKIYCCDVSRDNYLCYFKRDLHF